jgi:radical SAM superfamily enzyme YgiQ (UPF0313 family)
MGMMYVMSYIKSKTDDEVKFFNFQVPDVPSFNIFEDTLQNFKPDVIGVTVNTVFWWSAHHLLQKIRQILPSVLIVGGGPHMWLMPEEILKNSEFDIIVQGEGEKTFFEIIEKFRSGSGFETITGILYKDNGNIKINVPREIEHNPDLFPFPDRTGFNLEQYRHPGISSAATAIIFSTRGCPHFCTFCNNKDRAYRKRHASYVVDEIQECMAMGYKSIEFGDSNFNNSPQHVKAVCEELIRRDVKIPWTCNARIDQIDYNLLELMAEAGCQCIFFGLESADTEILFKIKKNINIHKVHDVFSWTRSLHIKTVGLFIIGFPGETREQVKKTFHLALKIDADYVICHTLIPVYGTEIYEDAVRDPNYDAEACRNFIKNPQPDITMPIWTTNISAAELYRLQRLFYLKFYFRPVFILRTIRAISGYEDIRKKFQMALRLLFNFR